MFKKKAPKENERVKRLVARRRTLIAICAALSLIAGWTILAYSGASRSAPQQKAAIDSTVSPASFSIASKEYIYAGSRLIGTEESPAPPPPEWPGAGHNWPLLRLGGGHQLPPEKLNEAPAPYKTAPGTPSIKQRQEGSGLTLLTFVSELLAALRKHPRIYANKREGASRRLA